MHQRKDVIEMQKKQLEDESRKHHAMNEQLNQVCNDESWAACTLHPEPNHGSISR